LPIPGSLAVSSDGAVVASTLRISVMTSHTRTREDTFSYFTSGSYVKVTQSYFGGNPLGGPSSTNGVHNGETFVAGHKKMTDAVSHQVPYDEHDLDSVRKQNMIRGIVDGVITVNTVVGGTGQITTHTFHNYVPTGDGIDPRSMVPPGFNSSYWKTRALALLNPTRPTQANIPLSLFELKDMPRMLKELGDAYAAYRLLRRRSQNSGGTKNWQAVGLAGYTPQALLSVNFGWGPLFSDLHTLLLYSKAVNNRLQFLKNIGAGKTIKRKLGSSTFRITEGLVIGDVVSYRTIRLYKDRQWCTAKYALKDPSWITDESERINAALSVYGLRNQQWLSLSQVWNMIPWSWLIDYFANIGDVLEASMGYAPVSIRSLNVMQETVVERTPEAIQGLAASIYTPFKHSLTSKRRASFINPTPSYSFTPYLTGHEQMILGSLVLSGILRSRLTHP
ncbi:maturation protein, partial [ssRNA phage SRR5467091_14]